MNKDLKEICMKNINLLQSKFNQLENKNKLILTSIIATFTLSKLLPLLKINIPGLSIAPMCLSFIFLGLLSMNKYKDTKNKLHLILSSILLGTTCLIISCLIITYPFIIASKILL
ncbi:MAG: hypothetical protein IJ086_02730 [Clostridium sp.]|nr:hypothetical protein [Clostridium sp.]MBQ8997593.1 hypothetical protein [Clostridium sp.]